MKKVGARKPIDHNERNLSPEVLMVQANGNALLKALQDPSLYPHEVRGVRVIETHISWVLLTGTYAYKIKKPVDLGFLDFSTLERRRHFCEEELRLNRRLAPDIYLDVVPLTGSAESPRWSGAGPAIEYAVRMREFPQERRLDEVLARGGLCAGDIETLAETIAAFHAHAACAGPQDDYGTPAAVWQPVAHNFEQIRPLLHDAGDLAALERLREWTIERHAALESVFAERKRAGRVRECHGDLHLANLVMMDGRIAAFDCLEFDPELRWIDVMSEVAFITMDLTDRARADLAARFLTSYLQASGDYDGLAVLKYYQIYRALVRAKVACIRARQSDDAGAMAEARRYLALAERYTRRTATPLVITHGLSGSGKTTITADFADTLAAVRVRSDVERKRLFGFAPEERSGSPVGGGIYTSDASARTYRRLAQIARAVIDAGYAVVIDAAFLKRAQRDLFEQLARSMEVPYKILHADASPDALRRRVIERAAVGRDASEADLVVLEQQLRTAEPLTEDERAHAIVVRTDEVI